MVSALRFILINHLQTVAVNINLIKQVNILLRAIITL